MASFHQHLSHFRQWQQDSSRHIAQPDNEKRHCACCGTDYAGNFCPQCGQKAGTGRITWKTVRQSFAMLWGMDTRSLPYTLWQLVLRPGYLIGDYIGGKRQVSFPPVKMLALVALCVFFANGGFSPGEEVQDLGSDQLMFNYAFHFFESHLDMAILFFFSFLIIPTYFIFRFAPRCYRHNLPEGFFIQVFNSTISLLGLTVVLIFVTTDEESTTTQLIVLTTVMLIIYRNYYQLFGYGHWSTLWRVVAVFIAALLSFGTIVQTDNIISMVINGHPDLAMHKFTHRLVPVTLIAVVTLVVSYLISRRTARHRAAGDLTLPG